VRVEDWRTWLDEQFFDTNPAKPAEDLLDVERDLPEVAGKVPETKPVAAPPESAARPAVAVASRVGGRASTVTDDANIPEIEQYLPFLRRASSAKEVDGGCRLGAGGGEQHDANAGIPVVPAPESALGDEPGQGVGAGDEAGSGDPPDSEFRPLDVRPEIPDASPAPSGGRLPAGRRRYGTDVPDAVAEPSESGNVLRDPTSAASDPESGIPDTGARPSNPGPGDDRRDDAAASSGPTATGLRRGRGRSRSARNVPPPELAPPLTGDAFWQLAPRHVRTLIAMGQDDTVQGSYKRQFKESRLALIERLLDPTLSLEDTARLLNVCPTTVRRYTNRGLIRHQRTPGDQRRFKLSDVLSFMEAQRPDDGPPDPSLGAPGSARAAALRSEAER